MLRSLMHVLVKTTSCLCHDRLMVYLRCSDTISSLNQANRIITYSLAVHITDGYQRNGTRSGL